MIGIRVADQYLYLPPSTKLRLVLNSPLFADDNIIPGSYSYNFDVPIGDASPKNDALLQRPFALLLAQDTVFFNDIQLFFDGCLLFKGTLQINSATPEVARCAFKFGLATLSNFKTAKLRDVCNDPVTITTASFTKRITLTPATSGTLKVIVNGTECTGGSVSALATAIDALDGVSATYIASPQSIVIQPTTGAGNLDTALTIVLPETEDKARYDLSSDDFANEYNNPMETWLNAYKVASPTDPRMRFPMMRNEGLYGDEKIKWTWQVWSTPTINFQSTSTFLLNQPVVDYNGGVSSWYPLNRTSIAPYVRQRWVLDTVAAYFGVGLEGDFLSDADFNNALFEHTHTLDKRVAFVGEVDWIATRRTFNVNEFVPDVSVPDFLKELQKRWNLSIYYNPLTNNLRLQKRRTIFRNTQYKDITHLCSGVLEVINELQEAVTLTHEVDKNDLLSAGITDTYTVGAGEELKVESNNGGLHVQTTDFIGSNQFTQFDLPNQKTKTDARIPFKTIFYAGLKTTTGVTYAAANIYASFGDWNFADLAPAFWLEYLTFLRKRKLARLTQTVNLQVITELDWEQKVMHDGIKYLYKQVAFDLSMTSIEPAEVELYRTTP
jgi:hypothetical protein